MIKERADWKKQEQEFYAKELKATEDLLSQMKKDFGIEDKDKSEEN